VTSYPGFDLQTQVAKIIAPDAWKPASAGDPDAAVFEAIQETRRVEAREKARRILDLCGPQLR